MTEPEQERIEVWRICPECRTVLSGPPLEVDPEDHADSIEVVRADLLAREREELYDTRAELGDALIQLKEAGARAAELEKDRDSERAESNSLAAGYDEMKARAEAAETRLAETEGAIERALDEIGVPSPADPAPLGNAYDILAPFSSRHLAPSPTPSEAESERADGELFARRAQKERPESLRRLDEALGRDTPSGRVTPGPSGSPTPSERCPTCGMSHQRVNSRAPLCPDPFHAAREAPEGEDG